MRYLLLTLMCVALLACNQDDIRNLEPHHHADDSQKMTYYEANTAYTFVSRASHESDKAYELTVKFDENGMLNVRHREVRAGENDYSKTVILAPTGEVQSVACGHTADLHDHLKILSNAEQYWLIPFSDPSAFMQVPGRVIDLICDCIDDCHVIFRGDGRHRQAVCATRQMDPCGMMAIGFDGEKIIRGGALLIKARGIISR